MNQLLTCKYKKCNKYLLDPIVLECSNNICKSHVDELIDHHSEGTFQCLVCDDQHKIPNNGFVVIKTLNEIMLLNLHLGEDAKKASDLVNKLNKKCYKLEKITNDPENFIFDYISDVRNKIDLERVRLINEINSISNEMLNKLRKFEEECKLNLEKISKINEQHKSNLSNYSNEILKWKEILRTPSTDKEVIDKMLQDTSIMIIKIKENLSDIKNNLLMNKTCSFNGMNTNFEPKLFGEFYLSDNYEHFNSSSILLSTKHKFDLIKLCEFDSKSTFKLIYQASKDDFTVESFHSKCDGVSNTLSLIKVKGNSNIFGGFCSVGWDSSHGFKNDQKAFIFSLINQDNLPLKINVTDPSKAIYCREDNGPIFGQNDFYLSNKLESGFSNLGTSYKNSLYILGTTKAQNILAGSPQFTTEEFEVYQVN